MAHNLNYNNGKYGYIGRQAAWTQLGTVTGEYFRWEDILAHGSLNFEVVKRQLEYNGRLVDAWGTFRTDKGVDGFLGSVGQDYTVIQHSRGYDTVDALVASKKGAHYETAGVLGKGETVWGLADLALTVRVGDDVQKGYLLFATAHDGSMAHTYKQCLERVVCANTLAVALAEKTKGLFRVKHTKNSGNRLDSAHEAIAGMSAEFQTMEQKLNFLAQRKVTKEAMVNVLDRLFPKRETDADGGKVNQTRRDNILTDVLRTYESNDDNAFPEQRGTAYNLLNAITNYADHQRSTQGNGRAESAMFGSGDRLKSQALQVITESANGMPILETRTIITTAPASMPVARVSLLDQIIAAS